jgi:hypothetical protein
MIVDFQDKLSLVIDLRGRCNYLLINQYLPVWFELMCKSEGAAEILIVLFEILKILFLAIKVVIDGY